MKLKLGGVEVDVLTTPEAHELVAGLRPERPRRIRAPINQKADAAGNAVIEVYSVPLGRVFIVTRVLVTADGFSPGAPFQAAAGYIEIRRQGGQVTDFISLAAPGGIPAISTDSDSAGGIYLNGETVEANIVGGAGLANVNLHVLVQGILESAGGVHEGDARASSKGSRR